MKLRMIQCVKKVVPLISVLVLLVACEKKANGPSPEELLVSAPTPTPAPWENPEYPNEIREEVYGNPEIFSTPRIQFLATVWDSERKDIWSMRMDGSDRRRVVAWQDLFDGATIVHTPVRSPDNRYIALSMDSDEGWFRGIYDLKEKKGIKIHDSTGYPMFNWTPDSESLIFNGDASIYKYHLPTGELKEYPISGGYAYEIFILPDGKRFLIFKGNGYWIVDKHGNILKKVDFGFPDDWSVDGPKMTPDGKYLYFSTGNRPKIYAHFVEVESGKILPELDKRKTVGKRLFDFSPDSRSLFNINYKKITNIELFTWKKTESSVRELWIWKMSDPSSTTVFNTKVDQES